MTVTLADEVLALAGGQILSLRDAVRRLAADAPSVRAAFLKLDGEGRAIAMRALGRGREWRLLPLGDPTPVCKVCREEFIRAKKSKRVTCDRYCHASLSWQDPAAKARRMASMIAQKRTPAGRAKQVKINEQRWARPGAREKMARQSRERWADPEMAAMMSAAIHAVQSSPKQRALYSAIRKKYWDDPEGRQRMIDGIRRSKSSPEARALFSKLLSERWQDPAMREKYIAGNKRNNADAGKRKRASERMTARHKAKRESSGVAP